MKLEYDPKGFYVLCELCGEYTHTGRRSLLHGCVNKQCIKLRKTMYTNYRVIIRRKTNEKKKRLHLSNLLV